jgi:F-type H+-transporting ATPase subunit gamma
MGAQLRVYRQKIKSAKTTKKITRAMELISASRIQKAQQRVSASNPYTRAVTRAVSAVATHSDVDHPLIQQVENPTRAAIVLFTSDRGLAGAFSSGAIKEAEQLTKTLMDRGQEVVYYLVGRKAVNYFKFRQRRYLIRPVKLLPQSPRRSQLRPQPAASTRSTWLETNLCP